MTYIGALSGSQSQGSSSVSTLFGAGSGISGLASGMDTDSIVNGLMQAESMPLVSVLQQRQIIQWQQELYQKVGNSMAALQQTIQPLQLQSTFLAQTAASSNTSIVSASATPQTPSGSYQVSVSQLAQGSTINSAQPLSVDPNYGNTTLATLMSSSPTSAYSVSINGEQFNFTGADTINTVMSQISHDTKSGVSAFYDSNSGKVVMQTTGTGTGAQISVTDSPTQWFSTAFKIAKPPTQTFKFTPQASGQGYIEINGDKVMLSGTDLSSASNAAVAINNYISSNYSGLGIAATAGTDANGNQTITFSYASGNTNLSQISLYDETGTLSNGNIPSGTAQDAIYSVNGYNSASSTNVATYNGLTLNLQGITKTSSGDNPVNITVSTDADAIVQNIMDFVKQYNNTVQYMQALNDQKRNLDYKPLTSQQASQMTQPQIDKWNQQAQSGLLANDMLLGGALDNFVTDVDSTMTGQPTVTLNGKSTELNSLSAIGIKLVDPINGVDDGYTAPNVTTTGYNTFGLLEVNSDTLKQAIQANPQAIMNLFTSSTTGNQGFAIQMYNTLSDSISSIKTQAGSSSLQPPTNVSDPSSDILPSTPVDPNGDFSTLFSADGSDISSLGESVKDLDNRATDMQTNLQDLKQRYQQEFSAMESALANMNSMSSAFTSMLGGSSSSGG